MPKSKSRLLTNSQGRREILPPAGSRACNLDKAVHSYDHSPVNRGGGDLLDATRFGRSAPTTCSRDFFTRTLLPASGGRCRAGGITCACLGTPGTRSPGYLPWFSA